MSMKFIPVGATKGQLQVGSGLPVEIDTAGNLKAAGKVQGQPATEAGDAVMLEQAFGVGQTRKNVTASRSLGVVYTNTTGRPIMLAFVANAPADGRLAVLMQDPPTTYRLRAGSISGSLGGQAIIFDGESYMVDYAGTGGMTNFVWEEIS